MKWNWPSKLLGLDFIGEIEVGGTREEDIARTEEALRILQQKTAANERQKQLLHVEASLTRRYRKPKP